MPQIYLTLTDPVFSGDRPEPIPDDGLVFFRASNGPSASPSYMTRIAWTLNLLSTVSTSYMGSISLRELDGTSLSLITPQEPGGEPLYIQLNQYASGNARGGHYDWYPSTADNGVENTMPLIPQDDRKVHVTPRPGYPSFLMSYGSAGTGNGKFRLSFIGGDESLTDGIEGDNYFGRFDDETLGYASDHLNLHIQRELYSGGSVPQSEDYPNVSEELERIPIRGVADYFQVEDSEMNTETSLLFPLHYGLLAVPDSVTKELDLVDESEYEIGDSIIYEAQITQKYFEEFEASDGTVKEITIAGTNQSPNAGAIGGGHNIILHAAGTNLKRIISVIPNHNYYGDGYISIRDTDSPIDLDILKLFESKSGIGEDYRLERTKTLPYPNDTTDLMRVAIADSNQRMAVTNTRESTMSTLDSIIQDISKILSSAYQAGDSEVIEAVKDLDSNFGVSAAHDLYWIRYLTNAMEVSMGVETEFGRPEDDFTVLVDGTDREQIRYTASYLTYQDSEFFETIKVLSDGSGCEDALFQSITLQEFYFDNMAGFQSAIDRYLDVSNLRTTSDLGCGDGRRMYMDIVESNATSLSTSSSNTITKALIRGNSSGLSSEDTNIRESIKVQNTPLPVEDSISSIIEYPVSGTLRYRFSVKPTVTVDETYGGNTIGKKVLDLDTGMLGGYANLEWHGRKLMSKTDYLSHTITLFSPAPLHSQYLWNQMEIPVGGHQWDGTPDDFALSNINLLKVTYLRNESNVPIGAGFPQLIIKFGDTCILKALNPGESYVFMSPGKHINDDIKRVGVDVSDLKIGCGTGIAQNNKIQAKIEAFGYGSIEMIT